MSMLEKEDSKTMKKLGLNFVILVGLFAVLIYISIYFS